MAGLTKKLFSVIAIVPAFNEGEMVRETVKALSKLKVSFKKRGVSFKVYVINDGSTDNTQEEAKRGGADLVVEHKLNKGLGAAIRSGLGAARDNNADICVKFDADLQHDPEDIFELIRPILDDEADIVYGKRFDRIKYKMPVIRRVGNRVFTALMRYLTHWPLEDSQPGIFAVNRDYLAVFRLPGSYNYTQQVLLDAHYNGMRFKHVSVDFKKRETGHSFVSLKYPFKVLYQILMLILSFKPMKIFGTAGIVILLCGTILFGWEFSAYIRGLSAKPVVHVNALLGLGLFGLHLLIFGLLAELIVILDKNR